MQHRLLIIQNREASLFLSAEVQWNLSLLQMLWQVCLLWSSMFPLRRLLLLIKCEYIFGIEDGDRLAGNLPLSFVLLIALPFAFDLTGGTSSSISSSAFEMIFFVETLRDFLSDASTVPLLAFSVGASTTESSTTEIPSLGFFVRFGGTFVSSGMVWSVRLMF